MKYPLRGEGRALPAEFSNPQPNPRNMMSYTTSANFGSPRGSVKWLKSLIPLAVTAEAAECAITLQSLNANYRVLRCF